ncbi:hypothetical protein B0I37DRAFT_87045 [Chaetomium sp. MPI-CAGE-AT-0009]|nr:hypothetical protein B0I37DRAFT_87045 [Chaetomium sp. MPI-CAGE-AT-0009]
MTPPCKRRVEHPRAQVAEGMMKRWNTERPGIHSHSWRFQRHYSLPLRFTFEFRSFLDLFNYHTLRRQIIWCLIYPRLPLDRYDPNNTMAGKHHNPVTKHHCPQCRSVWGIRCFQRGHFVYCKLHATYYPRIAACLKCENAARREERKARNERETKRKLETETSREIRAPEVDSKPDASKSLAKRQGTQSPLTKLGLGKGGTRRQTVPD